MLAAPLLVAVAACGGEERAYEVPDELCGVPVRPGLLEPLLPPGDELRQEKSSFGVSPGLQGCMVFVDGDVALDVTGKWRAAGHTAKEAASNPGPDLIEGGRYALWNRGAATVVPCRVPGQEVVEADGGDEGKAELFSLEVEATKAEDGTEKAMKALIGPYAEAYRETLPCRDG
ncbi:hypothetical protein [Streptomyces sp. JJ36]|uniref:hypothetical protein n=1 Tax=Streptomyces sp. JJ36 TaxID=2736645 RepID=UPI001F23E824|nr:hypothetical protein [Streptomyces sp. JJ36]MCF6526264.1 hypothetical protein [Streptomyces sp. JJ36]